MSQGQTFKTFVKGIPVVGPTARLGNRFRLFIRDLSRPEPRKDALLRLQHRASWYVLRNPQSKKLFTSHTPPITPIQKKMVDELVSKGVAARRYEEAGVETAECNRLEAQVNEFARFSADRIATATTSYSDTMELGALEHNRERFRRFFRDKAEAKLDDYILKMNPENSLLPSDHPLLTVGLSDAVLNVVSSYMKLLPKLLYADAWYSIPMDPGRRIGSQQWHRDPEDKQMTKVYMYFSNVDESAGAMEYVLGTSNSFGKRGKEIGEWKAAGANLYPSTELVEQTFPPAQRFYCSGSVGTLLFCDTTGLHRGGISRTHPRIVATWTFVTPSSRFTRRFKVAPATGSNLSDSARFALDM